MTASRARVEAAWVAAVAALVAVDAHAQGAPFPPQSALDPAGPQAAHIHDLWLLLFWVCTGVLAAVTVALLIALTRSGRGDERTPPDIGTLDRVEPRIRNAVATAVVLTVLTLMGLLAASVFTDRALASLPRQDAVNIELTGHQWWWEARYGGAQPSEMFITANELHIPVGKPVVLTLQASDVIHSLWIPNLHGKKDLIPGRTSTFELRADKPGIYRGQCAEFCGLQHAKMALIVVAESPEDYGRWLAAQRASPSPPTDPLAKRGQDVFMSTSCAMCHAVTGTTASAVMGPDLTHLASRKTIAAGSVENTRANRAAWILDPHQFKPGTTMPANALTRDDLDALLAYLDTLT